MKIVICALRRPKRKKLRKALSVGTTFSLFNLANSIAMASPTSAEAGAEQIRTGFKQVMNVAVAIAEPIIWVYAVIACVMIATNTSKDAGWNKLKNVGYAYMLMNLLPALFAFWCWMNKIIESSITLTQVGQ